jgi:two-component system OmpR family response regulator
MAKILVVEDDAALLELLESVLVELGHEVWVASDGDVGLDLAVETMPDLVVTDLVMPGLDGYELLSRLRQFSQTASIPVLVLSEHQGKDSRLMAFRIGCDDFLPKPFELEEFRFRVAHQLRATRSSFSPLAAVRVSMRGRLDDLALPSVLTMLEMERQSGVLELRSDDLHARLFLDGGRVVHAEEPDDPSADAFDVVCRALRLKQGKFAVRVDDVQVPDNLHLPMTQLLLDAFQRIDEEDARRAGIC